jgi:hypothetical protein
MQKKTLLFLALVVSLCFSACIKDNKNTAKTVDAIQSKVNVGNAFIVKDDRADKTQKPFSTYSDTRQLIKNYWGDTKQEQILNENVFRINELLMLFGTSDKIVFVVDGIKEKQLKIRTLVYEDAKTLFNNAENGNTFYYVLDKATLNRKTATDFEPDGIMYAKTSNGEPVTHVSASIGTDIKDNQTWHYFFLDAVKFDENGVKPLGVRGDPPGSGLRVPPTGG